MVTKKIRTEYMKKFRDPKWETFSKCYEDSVQYRLTRRVMEHAHRPWLWDGWDAGSDSSGRSTPRPSRNKILPLAVPPPPPPPPPPPCCPSEDGDVEDGGGDAPATAVVENGVNEAGAASAAAVAPAPGGPTDATATDSGPADTPSSPSSDGERAAAAPPKRRQRRRGPRSEPGRRDGSNEGKMAAARKPPRAKSQPAISGKENGRAGSRLDWTERSEVRRTLNDSSTSDACVQTRRESDKRSGNAERRRARSADLDKMRRSQLAVVDDRWMTEYMRCFSARLR